jgi:cytoskeleton protein RodZ
MTDPTHLWQPEDGKALAEARASTDLSRAEFARALCLSEKQLIQLEEGGSQSFYSERIKFQMGQRILAQFGLSTVSNKEIPAEKNIQSTEDDFKTEGVAELDNVIEANTKSLNDDDDDQPIFQLRKGYLLAAVIVVLVAIGFMLLPSPPSAKSKTPPEPISPKSAIEPIVASEPAASAGSGDATSATQPAPLPAVQLNEQSSQTTICRWDDTPLKLKPIGSSRPPDRVYLVANADLVVCLKDGADQVQEIRLKGGERRLVQGSSAPWLIYSPQMIYLKVFYQGFHVFIPGSNTQFIKLEPYP